MHIIQLLISNILVFRVYSLENGLARTPPMGWMSWTVFLCEIDCFKHPKTCISENLYREIADRMAEDGYRNAGYEVVHIDDCWMERQRNPDGSLAADVARFPSGISSLANYIHSRGLKFGIYADYGHFTCMGYPGSFGHIEQDAQTFASWGADYLKFDGCNIDHKMLPIGYPEMARALNKTGRPIVFSCSWPAYLVNQPHKVNYTEIGQACNLWRNFMPDVEANWGIIMKIVDYYTENQDKLIAANGPGHWNDPDMIVVGDPRLTPDQSRAQLTMWSIWSAPLIMSNDLRNIETVYKEILLNKRVIAVDQDPLGVMGRMVKKILSLNIYVKKMLPCDKDMQVCSYAIAILNKGHIEESISFKFSDIGLTRSSGYKVLELWDGINMDVFKPYEEYRALVPATGVHFIKATPFDFERSPDEYENLIQVREKLEDRKRGSILEEEGTSRNYVYLVVVVCVILLVYCSRRCCRYKSGIVRRINVF